MEVYLKQALPEDLNLIYDYTCSLEEEELNKGLFENIFSKNVLNPDWLIYLIQLNSITVGFCSLHLKDSLHHAERIAEIEEFYITKLARNKKIGSSTLDLLKKECRKREIFQLEVTTNTKREKAFQFYKNNGFKPSHHKLTTRLVP
ncbi:GNAT family N-acetyltransferase [Jiulongibacter sp. NS-SX5]|uniref:GNAT family N-acetyltransferase n=1 Tax=Jiulongibacter sp. NS-SX5 TaxID=3463854 RepID=UPI004058034C